MTIELFKFPYKYMAYENDLLLKELSLRFPMCQIREEGQTILLNNFNLDNTSRLHDLAYIQKYKVNGVEFFTKQALLEEATQTPISPKRQSTRYSSHGLHEYKGKYNPQIVKGMLNIMNVREGANILDPFCGSGTTMLECAHYGMSSLGTDINPMAVYLSNTKIQSLKLDVPYVRDFLNRVQSQEEIFGDVIDDNERSNYLRKWLPEEIFNLTENLNSIIQREDPIIANFLRVSISNLLREYSYQEPSDLRIRKRYSPFPDTPFLDAWIDSAQKQLTAIEKVQSIPGMTPDDNQAILHDIRKKMVRTARASFDAIITSPPYATALPYIDTQRISLVWLGLCDPKKINPLESTLIGSREFISNQRSIWKEDCDNNNNHLPDEVFDLIQSLKASVGENDGFRRQAIPSLLYRYFSDMKKTFVNTKPMLKEGGHFALIVGNNKTTLGGKKYIIDTPYYLSLVAKQVGWNIQELIPLQTYSRYGLNSQNAINVETMILLDNQ